MEQFGEPMIRMPSHAKKGSVIEIRSLIVDPMITGLVKNKAGIIPRADFIQSVTITFNDRVLTTAEWGTSVSANPYLAIKMRAETSGTLKMIWRDNRGRQWSTKAKLKVS